MKPLREVICQHRLCSHQYADDTHLDISISSWAGDAISFLNQWWRVWIRTSQFQFNSSKTAIWGDFPSPRSGDMLFLTLSKVALLRTTGAQFGGCPGLIVH